MVKMLRSAKGQETKWVVKTLMAHMSVGVSLEATVLPNLGAAKVWHDQAIASTIPGGSTATQLQGAEVARRNITPSWS